MNNYVGEKSKVKAVYQKVAILAQKDHTCTMIHCDEKNHIVPTSNFCFKLRV